MTERSFTLYTDGACRGNPGRGGAGAVLLDSAGNVVAMACKYLGHCTNNAAEYEALIMGIEEALKRSCRRLHIFLDSELLVKQLQGTYRVKNADLKQRMAQLQRLLSFLEGYKVEHVGREKNSLADGLANQAIDEAIVQGRWE